MEQSDLNLLQNVPPYHLQAIVKARRTPSSPNEQHVNILAEPSSMTVAEIAQHLFNPSTSRDAIQNLGEVEELILRELVACGGRANSRDLALYLTSSGLLNRAKGTEHPISTPIDTGHSPGVGYSQGIPLQYPTPHPHGVFEQALHRLLLQGLVFWGKQTNFIGRDYANGVYDGVLIVPQAVMEVAREEWEKQDRREHQRLPGADQCRIQESVDLSNTSPHGVTVEEYGEGVRKLQRMLYLYWSLVATLRDGLPLVNNQLLSRPALRQVVEQLGSIGAGNATGSSPSEHVRSELGFPQLLFIRLLLMKLELLYERHGALYAAPADTFFALSVLERTRRCYHLWRDTLFWNELAFLPDVIVRPGPAPLDPAHEEVMRSRSMVVERVLQEEPGEWHELAVFIARCKLYAPYLLFPRQYGSRTERYSLGSNPYGWDFRLRSGWLTHREGWHLVEGGFIRAVVVEPLHWLGLVDINSEETAFRLTSDAFHIAHKASTIEDMPAGRLIVQPNFELVALAPVSEALLLKLDRFAERVSLEHIAQYRLTKASVTSAIQRGLHTENIQELLEQAAGGEIPQNVRYSLEEWERQARRIELWRDMTLLEVDDAALLDALFADEKVRTMLGRRLAPLLAEVATDQLTRVQEILWQRNYLPALAATPLHDNLIESGRFPIREPQWRLHENGLMEPRYAVLNLYLVAELEPISEHDETAGWRKLTPSSIAGACNAGLPLEHIIRFLQSYCEGGLPTSFLIRLKLWGGGYSGSQTVSVEHAPLLSVPVQVLQDLKDDEELGELLGAEVASENRLVHVTPDKLERVMELLRKRGFEVQ